MNQKSVSEKGQALVFIAMAIVGLVALTGLTIDGGHAYSDRRHAQNAADTSALAAALAMVRGDDWQAAGLARAATNGYTDGDASKNSTSPVVNVEIYNPPISGAYAGNIEYVQVIITSDIKTYFAPIVGIKQLTNKVDAVARAEPTTVAPLFEGTAVIGLAPNECQAVKYQGTANTTLTGGGIFVNSDCPSAAFFNNSSSAQLKAPNLCSVGGVQYKPGALDITNPIQTGCESYGYPPNNLVMPNITCSDPAVKTGSALSPGYYSGTFPPSGVTFLQSGVYCVTDGNFRLNASDTLNGSGVTILVETGDIRWNGSANIALTAPESGPYKGLLIVMPLTNLSEVVINGNEGSIFTGSFLVPGANVTVNGTGGSTGTLSSQIIGYTVTFSGTSDIKINYDKNNTWAGGVPPKIELTE